MISGKDGKDGKDGKGGKVFRRWLTVAVVACLPVFPAFPVLPAYAQKDLKRRVDSRMDAPPFNRQFWGVALLDEGGRLLYGRNQDRLFIPASTT
jgi:hypothetical protein